MHIHMQILQLEMKYMQEKFDAWRENMNLLIDKVEQLEKQVNKIARHKVKLNHDKLHV